MDLFLRLASFLKYLWFFLQSIWFFVLVKADISYFTMIKFITQSHHIPNSYPGFNPFVQKCYHNFFTFFHKQKINKLQNIVSFVLIKVFSSEKVQKHFWRSNFSKIYMVNTCWPLVNTLSIWENVHKIEVIFLDV